MSERNTEITTSDKPRKPEWLKVKLPVGEEYRKVRELVTEKTAHHLRKR